LIIPTGEEMKRGSLLFILLSVICVNPVQAAAGDQFLLPKFGVMSIDLKNADPLLSVGFMWGFGLSDNISFEAEYNNGFDGGEYESTEVTATGVYRYRVNTVAGYLVHRYPMGNGSYFKTKVGLLHEKVKFTEPNSIDSSITDTRQTSDTGIAGGLGLGSSIGERLTLEFEMTLIDKDIIFYSLGTHYNF